MMFMFIENYGGRDTVQYFASFEAAVAKLVSTNVVYRNDHSQIDKDHLPDRIEGMKSAMIESGENFFSIRGIPYQGDDMDDMCLPHCEISISPIDFIPINQAFYEVCYISGYYNDVICGYSPWQVHEGYFNSVEEYEKAFAEDSRVKAWETDCGALGFSGSYLAVRRCYLSA